MFAFMILQSYHSLNLNAVPYGCVQRKCQLNTDPYWCLQGITRMQLLEKAAAVISLKTRVDPTMMFSGLFSD